MQSVGDSTGSRYREPLRDTLKRTVTIAAVAGALLARSLPRWPAGTLLALWPSFGGHWVEVLFLDFIRPRIAATRSIQTGTRLTVWFFAGMCLEIGMKLPASVLPGFRHLHWPAGWIAGLAFIVIELTAHIVLQLRGRPSVFNGRG